MRNITLSVPRVIAGEVRYPVEGPILVSDDDAEAIIDAKEGHAADLTDEPENLDKMKVEDLKALAVAEEIDLGDKTKKTDIIAVIRAAREAAAAQ